MRSVLPGDLRAAACALLPVPRAARGAALAALLARAEAADRYRRRLGRAHPAWGDGTLAAAAGPVPPEPFADDPDYLDALGRVVAVLAARRGIAPAPLSL